MLQGLVVESTRNSDAASLSMLLPLFERTGWLVGGRAGWPAVQRGPAAELQQGLAGVPA